MDYVACTQQGLAEEDSALDQEYGMEEDDGSEDGHDNDMTPEELRQLAMDHDQLFSSDGAMPEELQQLAMVMA